MGWYNRYSGYGFKPYVSVGKRQANAAKEIAKLAKKGRVITPIKIEGFKIAKSFWGKAWCDHLESYSDYSNRLDRGRTYVRNGSVVDLQISEGKITAMVSGSELYDVEIKIKPLTPGSWKPIRDECRGKIGSLVELLMGKLSGGVMEIVTRKAGGLFPTPSEIDMDCSCPDYAGMCKHIAATLYGVGARLDHQPELLFTLRKVDHFELIAQAESASGLLSATTGESTIATGDLEDVFGIELDRTATAQVESPVTVAAAPRRKSPSTGVKPAKASALRKDRTTKVTSVKANRVAKPARKAPQKPGLTTVVAVKAAATRVAKKRVTGRQAVAAANRGNIRNVKRRRTGEPEATAHPGTAKRVAKAQDVPRSAAKPSRRQKV